MVREELVIPPIILEWCHWVVWNDLKVDARGGFGVRVPEDKGVYEAKYSGADERLTIGKASNLRRRVKEGLVRGVTSHEAGDKIRAHEDVSLVVVRWARCERPAAAEEELHLRHVRRFGQLPKYVGHT